MKTPSLEQPAETSSASAGTGVPECGLTLGFRNKQINWTNCRHLYSGKLEMDTTFVFRWLNPTKLFFKFQVGLWRWDFEIQNVCPNAKPLWRLVFKIPKVPWALIKLQDTCSKSVWGHHSGHSVPNASHDGSVRESEMILITGEVGSPWCMCDGVEASDWSASWDAGFWLAAYRRGMVITWDLTDGKFLCSSQRIDYIFDNNTCINFTSTIPM